MERREALKNLGFGSLAVFTSTALFGALQGCSVTPKADWSPIFLTPEEAAQLEKICEAILPKTNTPGATDAGVAIHLDSALANIYEDEEPDFFKRGLAAFIKNFNNSQEVSFNKSEIQLITDVINAYFKKYEADESILKSFRESFDEDGEKTDEFCETYFVTNAVDSTFWSYFTSELVGETVMRYDPIPGPYQGCIPYEKGQKSWSSVG